MTPNIKKWISRAGMVTGLAFGSAAPAYAQITQLTSTLDWVKTSISGVGVVILIIALMWVGVKMMFQHARWSEVAHIFFGAVLFGGAAAIGPQLFGGGSAG